jgi:hypothetical protein
MKTQTKVAIVTLVLGIVAFLTEPNGPLGAFWAPAPSVPQAIGVQVPFFMLLGVFEALSFGLGVAFLLYGYSPLKATFSVSTPLARAAHLSIAWLLINWWAHDSLHLHNGMNLNGLLGIEYAFHVTLIIAGAILARFFVALVRVPSPA